MNRTLQEKARSMIKAKKLANNFWGEAVRTVAYLTSRSATKAVRNITLEEAWSRIKPTIAHLKIFGSTAHMHVPKEKRHKLDDKSSKCIFLGYNEVSKAYRVYELK